jgi:hypothetical protein
MTAQEAWKLFCATGAPEYYLLFQSCLESSAGQNT